MILQLASIAECNMYPPSIDLPTHHLILQDDVITCGLYLCKLLEPLARCATLIMHNLCR